MIFAHPQDIKQPKGGLILEERNENDYVLGATAPWEIVNPERKWRNYMPVFELQKNRHGDVWGCVSFSYNSAHEFIHIKKYSKEINKNDRFVVVGSGTVPNQGNSKRAVAEWGRKNFWIDEPVWPYTSEMTVDEYYNNGLVPQEFIDQALKLKSCYEMQYQWLPGNEQKQILDGLQFSPVQVDVERYSFNNKGYIINTSTGYYHEVLIFDFEENECWWVFDSEANQIIKFDWNYNFGSPMIHSLKKKNMAKIYKKKGEPALYFLNPKDQKLVSFSDGVISGGDLFKTLFVEYFFEEYDELPYPVANYSIKTV